MNASRIRPIGFCALLCLMAAPAFPQIDYHSSPRARLVPTISANPFVVSGKVLARSARTITLQDGSSEPVEVAIDENTSMSAAGGDEPGQPPEMGERVRVSVVKSSDGALRAIELRRL